MPKNEDFYRQHDIETEEGASFTSRFDSLVSMTSGLGEGTLCPSCKNTVKGVFFGDPDGDHWCAYCQFNKDHDLEESIDNQSQS